MIALFAIFVAIGLVFSTNFFITFTKYKDKGLNKAATPFYLIVIAIGAWIMTMPALQAPVKTTLVIPTYTVTANQLSGSTWTNTITTYPQVNETTWSTRPYVPSLQYIYMPFWIAVLGIHLIALIFMLLGRTEDIIQDDIGHKG